MLLNNLIRRTYLLTYDGFTMEDFVKSSTANTVNFTD